ncbi:complement C3-like isoform X1 [Amblyomma americanum]
MRAAQIRWRPCSCGTVATRVQKLASQGRPATSMWPLIARGLPWIFWICVFCVPTAWSCMVTAPRMVRPGVQETIAVFSRGLPRIVTLTLSSSGRQTLPVYQDTLSLGPGESRLVSVWIDPVKLVAPGESLNESAYVSLVVQCGRVYTKEARIPISPQSGYLLLQSDKPIYTPKQTVHLRMIAVGEDLMPKAGDLKLQIKNPQNVTMQQVTLSAKDNATATGMYSHSYSFPESPILGEWKAVVTYGSTITQQSEIAFEVDEYVLPTFSVSLAVPSVILPGTSSAVVRVDAEYVYGRKVAGSATCRLKIRYAAGAERKIGSAETKHLVRGIATFNVPTSEIREPSVFLGARLVVEATVLDRETTERVSAVDDSALFATSPYVVGFASTRRSYLPGVAKMVTVDIRHVDGKPAAGVPCAVTAESDEGAPLAVIQSSSVTDAMGTLDFHVFANAQSTGFSVKVRTLLPEEARHQAQGRVHIPALNHAFDAYCVLHPNGGRKLFKVGETYVTQVFAQPGGAPVYYLVTQNGRIIHHGVLRKQRLYADFPPLGVLVTPDMAPIFRLLVLNFHRGHVFTDSIAIEVEPVCSESSNIAIKPEFSSELPGSNGSLKILGTAGTRVGVLGVDKAVYTLSSKGLLTRDKLFETLRSHDMGCGPGGGETPDEVLSESGVVIIAEEAADLVTGTVSACASRIHRRRRVSQNLPHEYSSDPFLDRCCSLGLKPDRANRDCVTRSRIVRRYIPGARGQGCAQAFQECCFSTDPQPSFSDGLPGRNPEGVGPFIVSTRVRIPPGQTHGMDDDHIGATLTRKDFRETWLFDEKVIGANGVAAFAVSLPHSITTWSVQAVSVSPVGGVCVPKPEEVRSFQPVFLQVALPYKVVRNEQIEVLATVYNYGNQLLQAIVHIYGVEGLCTGAQKGERSEGRNVLVAANSASSVTFPVVPLREGTFVIKVRVLSSQGVDVVEKELNVVPEGVPVEKRVSVPIDPTNAGRINARRAMADIYEDVIDQVANRQVISVNTLLPPDAVPGTKSCSLSVTGNRMRPPVQETLEQVEALLKIPAGNGEQNALLMAQALYAHDYLTRGSLTDKSLQEKSRGLLTAAYQRQLSFRNENGSFSSFKDALGSVWLTAFATRIMCQATRYASIDYDVIKTGLAWLIRKRQESGNLHFEWPLVDKSIPGPGDRAVSTTAFIGRTFRECWHVVKPEGSDVNTWQVLAQPFSPGGAYTNMDDLERVNPHGAALMAYLFLMMEHQQPHNITSILKQKLIYDPVHNTRSAGSDASPLVVESTAYVLLVLLASNDSDTEMIQTLANWLELHRSSSDIPTHHSVVALEALTEFALKYQQSDMDLTCNVTHSGKRAFQKSIRIKRDNAAVLQHLDVHDVTGKLLVTANGTGSGLLSVRLKYNVLLPPELVCMFNISVRADIHTPKEKSAAVSDFPEELLLELLGENRARRSGRAGWSLPGITGTTASQSGSSQQSKLIYDVEVCAQYLSESDSNMTVIEVGLLSGFVPIAEDLKAVKIKNQLLANYVITEKNVMLYFHWIPWRNATCLKFRTERQHVVYNVQSALVKVYDYYDPTRSCTQFYGPDSTSPLLKLTCERDECRCVEDECPPREPFRTIDNVGATSEKRRKLLDLACKEHDFVWVGTVSRNHVTNGYRQIELRVDTVIKQGAEQREAALTGTKLFVARKHCNTADMSEGSRYFVFGRDGELFEKDGVVVSRYILDKHVRLFDTKTAGTSQSASRINSVLQWLTASMQRSGGCQSS